MKKIVVLFAVLFVVKTSVLAQATTPSDTESNVAFVIKNMGMNVDGSLKGLKGSINFDPNNLAAAFFDVTVDVNTINTGIEKRDKHLKTSDFFDAQKFPVIHIKTVKIVSKGGGNYAATAVLTMKSTSKNIGISFTAKPGANGYLFVGSFTLNRRDYGVGGSSMVVGDDVTVNLTVQGKK